MPVMQNQTEHANFLKNSNLSDEQIHYLFDDDSAHAKERQHLVLSLRDNAFQERLFSLAVLSPKKYTLEDLFPAGQSVVYEGRNTFPAFSRFQKIFHLAPGANKAYGYNKQSTSFITGPGYFSVVEKPNGVLLFDYSELPPQQPAGFPALVGNDSGIGKLVYGGLQDDVAIVSKNVLIGKAQKDGKVLGYFILVK